MADFDAVVVGSGPAGAVAAYRLAQAGKSVLVVERGNYAGAKNMTGGRVYAHVLKELFPDFEQEAPLERKITHEKLSFISEEGNFTVDFTSPELGREGADSYSVLRAHFDPWLAQKAEDAGAEYIFGIAVEDLIQDDGKVVGVMAGGDEITADVIILADGVNSLLTERAGLATTPPANQMAVGVKEVIQLPSTVIDDRMNVVPGEGAAWLFVGSVTKGHVGGGFLYANKESVSLGLVATLSDLCTAQVPVYQMMEDFKRHPAIAPLIAGGSTVEYSGHLIPEGGFNMIPTLYKDGCLVVGDAAMLCINLGYQVRGIDFAMASGSAAAAAAIEALDAGDVSANKLATYKTLLQNSFVLKDLESFRRFPHFMESTTRLFTAYPALLDTLMQSLFVVDGTPVTPIKKTVKAAVRSVGLMNILKDVRGGMKAL
jgi:electron transfer flavoprotein-quinone oxidoreductase